MQHICEPDPAKRPSSAPVAQVSLLSVALRLHRARHALVGRRHLQCAGGQLELHAGEHTEGLLGSEVIGVLFKCCLRLKGLQEG